MKANANANAIKVCV